MPSLQFSIDSAAHATSRQDTLRVLTDVSARLHNSNVDIAVGSAQQILDALIKSLCRQPSATANANAKPPIIEDTKLATIHYVNHRKEYAMRNVLPIAWRHGVNEWYTTPQWLMRAYDMGKQEEREFALNNILRWDDTL